MTGRGTLGLLNLWGAQGIGVSLASRSAYGLALDGCVWQKGFKIYQDDGKGGLGLRG